MLTVLAGTLFLWPTAQSSAAVLTTSGQGGTNTSSVQAIRSLGFTSSRWHLTLNSNFQNQAPNPNVWTPGWFSPNSASSPTTINTTETSCYSSSNLVKSASGLGLNLSANQSTCNNSTQPYTGALMTTNPYDGRKSGGFQFRYGIIQAKIYLPAGGHRPQVADWPVLLTLGQPAAYAEDDIMEGLVGSVCSHYHSPSYSGYAGLGGCDHTLGPGWHIFTADWEPGSVTWYYDGKRYARVTDDISSASEYLVLGNTSAAWPTTKPDTMKVAYVNVWQRAPVKK